MKQILTVAENKENILVSKKKTAGENAIEGLVIPNKWDENGMIIGIAIYIE
jgi:hypothetical protein